MPYLSLITNNKKLKKIRDFFFFLLRYFIDRFIFHSISASELQVPNVVNSGINGSVIVRIKSARSAFQKEQKKGQLLKNIVTLSLKNKTRQCHDRKLY